MTRFFRAAAFVAALVLSGCGVGPDYHRPALDMPAGFSSTSEPAAPPPATDWWRGFGAPELDRLIEKAAAASPDVQAAAARIVQADQAARVAGSPLLPGVTGQLGQNWERAGIGTADLGGTTTTSSLGAVGTPGSNQKYFETRSYSANLSASYEVDFWGKNRDALRAAQATALGSRFDAQTVWLTTASSIATTYFQALGYRDRLAIAEHNYAAASDVLRYYRGRLGGGHRLPARCQPAGGAGRRLPRADSGFA